MKTEENITIISYELKEAEKIIMFEYQNQRYLLEEMIEEDRGEQELITIFKEAKETWELDEEKSYDYNLQNRVIELVEKRKELKI